MANRSTNNKNRGKKAYKQKKNFLGFDMTDMESRIAFYAFAVIFVALSALLIVGFALGISRCVSPEVPEDDGADTAVTGVSDTDISGTDIVGVISLSGGDVLSVIVTR